MATAQSKSANHRVPALLPVDRYLLTVSQAAARLGVSPKTVWGWLYARKFPAVRLSGRCVRIPSDAIDRMIADSTVPARPEVQ